MRKNLDSLDDRQLVAHVAAGDEHALGVLHRRHAALCVKRAQRILRDRTLAEDAVQEAFLDLWKTAVRFDADRCAVAVWLCVLTHRRAVDIIRREAVRRRTADRLPAPDVPEFAAEEQVILLVERRRVRAAVAELSDEHRQLVELAYYGGLTQADLAGRLHLPLGTVKSRTSAALAALAKLLAQPDALATAS